VSSKKEEIKNFYFFGIGQSIPMLNWEGRSGASTKDNNASVAQHRKNKNLRFYIFAIVLEKRRN
jgi:hypothetical protein